MTPKQRKKSKRLALIAIDEAKQVLSDLRKHHDKAVISLHHGLGGQHWESMKDVAVQWSIVANVIIKVSYSYNLDNFDVVQEPLVNLNQTLTTIKGHVDALAFEEAAITIIDTLSGVIEPLYKALDWMHEQVSAYIEEPIQEVSKESLAHVVEGPFGAMLNTYLQARARVAPLQQFVCDVELKLTQQLRSVDVAALKNVKCEGVKSHYIDKIITPQHRKAVRDIVYR